MGPVAGTFPVPGNVHFPSRNPEDRRPPMCGKTDPAATPRKVPPHAEVVRPGEYFFKLKEKFSNFEFDVRREARNTLFCPSQEKFHTVVLRGVRNVPEAP